MLVCINHLCVLFSNLLFHTFAYDVCLHKQSALHHRGLHQSVFLKLWSISFFMPQKIILEYNLLVVWSLLLFMFLAKFFSLSLRFIAVLLLIRSKFYCGQAYFIFVFLYL